MLTWLGNALNFYIFLLVAALCLTAPLIAALFLSGARARPTWTALLLAGAALATAAVFVVRTDWLAGALVINGVLVPVLLLQRPARRRVGLLLAAGFYAATAYVIWRMEWFDVWRHGFPGMVYLLQTMVPFPAAMALAGWVLGTRFGARRPAVQAAG